MDDSPAFSESGRLLAQDREGDNAAPLGVSELSQMLKRTVEDRFGHVKLRGEISGWKRAASGHAYLCLKDDNAVIDGVMWKGSVAQIPFAAEDGLEVVATGKVTTYPGRSKYQIVIERMELAGEGALMQLLDRLRKKLAAEGLFDHDRKRPLPFMPRTIGVVTSPTGAVIRDILHRLADRCPTNVLVWPVRVQGDGAAAEVAAAVRGFDAIQPGGPVPRPDLVIVARGGGSIEDLWAFNEEVVVRAVAGCSIPTISAVGHETDTSLCDFAADMRAPTPTAAAEMAVPVRADLVHHVTTQGLRMERCVRRGLDRAKERLDTQTRLMPTLDTLLQPQRQRADDLADRLRRGLQARIAHARRDLAEAGGALRPALLHRRADQDRQRLGTLRLRPMLLERRIGEARTALDRSGRLFASLNPDAPLSRGFARVMLGDRLVRTAKDARAAGHVVLTFKDGSVGATVEAGSWPASPPPAPSKAKPAAKARPDQESQQDLFS